ncbi:hypothetical protein FHU09_3731 [Serratia fonticola]|nr:hypothetical protein FHU09_3731 [Serratia fonticola]
MANPIHAISLPRRVPQDVSRTDPSVPTSLCELQCVKFELSNLYAKATVNSQPSPYN